MVDGSDSEVILSQAQLLHAIAFLQAKQQIEELPEIEDNDGRHWDTA
jgi:hypothetical protein